MRVAALSLPIGPILFALKLADDVVTAGGYLGVALAPYRPAAVLLGCLKISALALPTVAMLSIGMCLLGKLRRDSFLMAFVVGTVLLSAGVGITLLATVGTSLGMDIDDPYVRYAAITILVAIVLAVSALLSALYWLFAVRRDRRHRLLAENDARAIRAME